MTTEKLAQPAWNKPINATPDVPLVVFNSMTKKKEEFVNLKGRKVGWYSCGPTVYDASHMGHARAYITFDILRRIMEDYFGYNVLYVMNITDIDDKIIIAARKKYLFDNFKRDNQQTTPDTIEIIKKALESFIKQKFEKYDPLVASRFTEFVKESPKFENTDPKFSLNIKIATKAKEALGSIQSSSLLDDCKEVISQYLDDTLGHSVKDPKLFRDFAAYWEEEYFKDMDQLNVKRPDVLTRVSEYVPEIISFVEKIIGNGYGYRVGDSVYFDTIRFDQSESHFYAKLEPWSAGNVKLMQEGEGDLTKEAVGKKHPSDFALWKGSKPGEPEWDSPWGKGRPGWHIECSAMASEVLGEQLDIHSGGIDLAFPHHDNEMAQSEAHFDCKQWVNYFIHAGHLHIEGQKMSKSLKNFVTIQEALEKYSANQIRMMFLLHQWDSVLDFKAVSMNEAKDFESRILNFINKVNALELLQSTSKPVFTGRHNFNEKERNLLDDLEDKQELIHRALCDSFDTSTVMQLLSRLVSSSNTYISTVGNESVNCFLLAKIRDFVSKMLRIFGINLDKTSDTGSSIMPYLAALSGYRDSVRELAKQKAEPIEFLNLSDRLRDLDLVELGINLEDQPSGKALIKISDKETILEQREEKRQREEQKQLEKQARLEQERLKKLERLEKGKLDPREMFKTPENLLLYSKWDENGLPTHGIDGEEVAKSKRKKLQKEYEAQTKLHNEFLSSK